MSKPPTTLDTLLELARSACDRAGDTLRQERRDAQQIEARIGALEQYRQEYLERLQQAMARGIDPVLVDNYRRFLASLDSALEGARSALAAQHEKVEGGIRHWHNARRRVASYDTLASRRVLQQAVLEQRAELRASDELVTGLLARRQAQRGR